MQNGELYDISVTPVYVDSGPGEQRLANVLVAGYSVDALVAQKLKEATGSEFLFLQTGGRAAAIDAESARHRRRGEESRGAPVKPNW